SFPTLINGLNNNPIPTSRDIYLYADPVTYNKLHPLLFADYKGFRGGESVPRAKDEEENSLFTIGRLFPRILYTFSDIIVFVI
ncbi:hypothetical protein QBC40DRAFT_189046, partial [Triangularia verruculosa]